MVVIYGSRSYGRIESHAGEYAQTRFAHVYYMPLLPVASFWVSREAGDMQCGFPIRMSAKSVLVTYLRMWGAVAAILALVSGTGIGYVVAALAVASMIWAWSTRSVRGSGAIHRSDLRLLAYGARCAPTYMTQELRKSFKIKLEERWQKLGLSRPPDDTAQFGATSIEEAAVAYGLLALAAADGDARSHAAAETIAEGVHAISPVGDGPYRAATPMPAKQMLDQMQASVASAKEAADAASLAEVAAVREDRHARRVAFHTRPKVPWYRGAKIFIPIAGAASIALLLWTGAALLGPQRAGVEDLSHPSIVMRAGFVSVRCDRTVDLGEFSNHAQATACVMDSDRMLPVLGSAGAETTELVGELQSITSTDPVVWPDEIRTAPGAFPVYLEVKSPTLSIVCAILSICAIAATGGYYGAVLWRRRRRANTTA
jgi:hypothetical protein